MFNKKEASNPDVFDTLIGTKSTFEGNIQTDGTLRVDGKVNGDLKVNGDVYVGKDAEINGNIYAHSIFLSGKVQGNVETKGMLRAMSTAKLIGDIMVQSLVTDEGSVFEGKCKMIGTTSDQPKIKSETK